MFNQIKVSGNGEIIAINNQKEEKIMENTIKTEEKPVVKSLEEQHAELKAANSPVLAEARKVAKSDRKPRTVTPKPPVAKAEAKPTKGGDTMKVKSWREEPERLLFEVAKECKVNAPVRANPPSTSKSGIGSLQLRIGGGLRIAVRECDRNKVIIYAPHDALGLDVSYRHPGEYGKYCSYIPAHELTVMRKAFVKAIKDKTPGLKYAEQNGFSIVIAKGTKAEREAAAEAVKAAKKVKRVRKTASKAVEKVAAQVIAETPKA